MANFRLQVKGEHLFAPPCSWLRCGVTHVSPVHDAGDNAQLHADARHGCGFLRREDAAHVLRCPLCGHGLASGNSCGELLRQTLIVNARLARRVGLLARLGDARVQLGEHLHDLGHIGALVDSDGEGVRAGDGVLLGHDRPLSVLSG